ncbi:unnamed protein product [Amoebophrya sp. A25]|nr:unnamed protein product [Amoebophrya sp. A25]|eukprot:GSA25T00005088001.1
MGHKSNPYKKARSAFRWKVEEEAHAPFAEEEEEDETALQVSKLCLRCNSVSNAITCHVSSQSE